MISFEQRNVIMENTLNVSLEMHRDTKCSERSDCVRVDLLNSWPKRTFCAFLRQFTQTFRPFYVIFYIFTYFGACFSQAKSILILILFTGLDMHGNLFTTPF